MLRKKLKLSEQSEEQPSVENINVKVTFEMMFWEKIWQVEKDLCNGNKYIYFPINIIRNAHFCRQKIGRNRF